MGRVLVHSPGVYRLQIGSPMSVLRAAKMMLSYTFKKYSELKTVIDYYENRVSGRVVLLSLNEAVLAGVRAGKIREVKFLPKYAEGKHNVARSRGLRGAEVKKVRKTGKIMDSQMT